MLHLSAVWLFLSGFLDPAGQGDLAWCAEGFFLCFAQSFCGFFAALDLQFPKAISSTCLHGALEGSVFRKIGTVVAQAGIRGEPGGAHWKLVQYMKSLLVQTGSNNSTEMQGLCCIKVK